jgi:hypothetical protein
MGELLASAWVPPKGVTRHAGSPISSELDFFLPPPPEIGQIISADSTLNIGQQPTPMSKRMITSCLVGLVAGAIAWGILYLISQPYPVVLAIVGLIAGVIAYFCYGFHHSCTYVGEQGIAEIRLNGSREATPQTHLLLFQEAANLYTSQTRRYKNGFYRGTSYSYQWTRPRNKTYVLSGQYHSEQGWPEDRNLWHFANSAETAWSSYMLGVINEQLTRLGYVEFPMQGNPQAVRVGQGFLEFVLKDGTMQRAAVEDMRDMRLGAGQFHFTHKDARWWSGKGKYSFTYSTIPNARLFLICMRTLAGITF